MEGECAEFQAATSVIIHEGLTCHRELRNSQAAGFSRVSNAERIASISFWPMSIAGETDFYQCVLDKLLTMNFRSGDGGSSSRNAFYMDVGEPFAHACSLCQPDHRASRKISAAFVDVCLDELDCANDCM